MEVYLLGVHVQLRHSAAVALHHHEVPLCLGSADLDALRKPLAEMKIQQQLDPLMCSTREGEKATPNFRQYHKKNGLAPIWSSTEIAGSRKGYRTEQNNRTNYRYVICPTRVYYFAATCLADNLIWTVTILKIDLMYYCASYVHALSRVVLS